MKKFAFFAVFISLIFNNISVFAAETNYVDLDHYVQNRMRQSDTPCLSLGIVKDGELQYLQQYNVNQTSSETVQTIYPIASVSKVFTALAARQLINKGALNENAPVEQYLPDFRSNYRGSRISITVGQLIHHLSGISKIDGGKPYIFNAKYSLAEVAGKSMLHQLDNIPGEVYEYSNMNYILLGRIIEVVSGIPYEKYVRENILDPLGMDSTFSKASELGGIIPVKGHIPFYGLSVPFSYFPSNGDSPTGGFLSTAGDICRLIISYQQGGYVGEVSLIEENTITSWNSDKSGLVYDIYWTKAKREDGMQLIHNGCVPGYSSAILMDIGSGYGIVILTNSFDQIGLQMNEAAPWDMAQNVLAYLTNGQFPEPVKASYDYSILMWFICLFIGLAGFIIFLIRHTMQSIHKQTNLVRELIHLSAYFILPALWVILIPIMNDCRWEWLLISHPVMNISLLCIMAALVLTGIGKASVIVVKKYLLTKTE